MLIESISQYNFENIKLIKNLRFIRKVTKYLLVLSIFLIALIYLILISPSFYPANYSNSAVQKFLLSDSFKQYIKSEFDKLKEYNLGIKNNLDGISSELIAIDPSQIGLVVIAHYKLLPQYDHILANGNMSYKYVPEITIQKDFNLFSYFLITEFIIFIIFIFLVFHKENAQEKFFDEQLGDYYETLGNSLSASFIYKKDNISILEEIFNSFHKVAIHFNKRSRGREAIKIDDEYDVQYILYPLLLIEFSDIRVEETTSSCAGTSSKIDFYLKNENIIIECKKIGDNLTNKKLVNQIAEDKQLYRSNDNCRTVFFFIYDPEGKIKNPRGFEKDLSEKVNDIEFRVLIRPS